MDSISIIPMMSLDSIGLYPKTTRDSIRHKRLYWDSVRKQPKSRPIHIQKETTEIHSIDSNFRFQHSEIVSRKHPEICLKILSLKI
jgi:hypothetical protein